MSEDMSERPHTDLLPVRQRIAWMALIWSLSVLLMVSVTLAIRTAF